MPHRWLRLLPLASLALLALSFASCSGESDASPGAVHFVKADTEIDPISERYIDRAIGDAESSQAALVVIELDTPGGLSESMRKIVQRIERATVPVAVYVTPKGARAASAGTFITIAAHIAAMAPNTSIGAASAINSDGSDIGGTLGRKVENDAVALIRGSAELRGRNADWAELAVRDAVAATSTEAVDLHVVDFIASDRADLLRQSEGRSITLDNGTIVELRALTEAPEVEVSMSPWENVLKIISNPTIASLLLSIAFFGIIMEMANPGLILPGLVGAICLALGFLGFNILPVNTVGIVLIVLALAFFGLELFVPSGGMLGGAGVVAMILGAFIAFHDTPADFRPPAYLGVALGAAVVGVFVAIAFGTAHMVRWSGEKSTPALVGKLATARTELSPKGYVFLQGERWRAESVEGPIVEGAKVRILEVKGKTVRVRKEDIL